MASWNSSGKTVGKYRIIYKIDETKKEIVFYNADLMMDPTARFEMLFAGQQLELREMGQLPLWMRLELTSLESHRPVSLHGFRTMHLAGVMPRPSMTISRAL